MLAALNWKLWLTPALLIGGGLLTGVLLERLFMKAMSSLLHRTSLDLDRRLLGTMRGIMLALFVVLGLHLATYAIPDVTPAHVEIVRRLLLVLGMLVAIRMVSAVAVVSVRFYLNHHEGLKALPNTSIFENVIRGLIWLMGVLVLLQTLGISVVPILTALGVGGLAISLALQDTLANMFAGINMILSRQIKVNDYISLQDTGYEGYVVDIGWRNTVIRKLNNNQIIVPNSKMASDVIVNTTLPLPEMSVLVEVSVSYNSNLRHVERVVEETGKEILTSTEGGVVDFDPFIRYHTFGDSGIGFTVILRVHTWVDQYLVKHRFIQRLHERFGEENIEIPFPQRVVHMQPS